MCDNIPSFSLSLFKHCSTHIDFSLCYYISINKKILNLYGFSYSILSTACTTEYQCSSCSQTYMSDVEHFQWERGSVPFVMNNCNTALVDRLIPKHVSINDIKMWKKPYLVTFDSSWYIEKNIGPYISPLFMLYSLHQKKVYTCDQV